MSGLHLVVWIDVIIHAQIAKAAQFRAAFLFLTEGVSNAEDAEVFAEGAELSFPLHFSAKTSAASAVRKPFEEHQSGET